MQTEQLYIRLSPSYIQSLLFNSLLSEIPMDKRLSHPAMLFGFVYLFCFPLVCYAGDKGRAQQQTARNPVVPEIPFEFEHNQIILSIRMNGKGPYNMFLDTGGDPSAVVLGAAKDAGIPLDISAAGEDEGVGTQKVSINAVQIINIEIGDHGLGTVDAVALRLHHISKRSGRSEVSLLQAFITEH